MIKLQVRVIYAGHPPLNIRQGPGIQHPDIGNLSAGTVLNVRSIVGKDVHIGFDPVLDITGTDVWIEFAPGQWAAFAYGRDRYMQVVG